MLKQYIQLSEPVSVETVVAAMLRGETYLPVKHLNQEVINVPISSVRMQTYTKGVACVNCGKEGHFFIVEKMRNDKSLKGHFNLYHRHKDGSLRMMTSDHIVPKSRGGSCDDLDNRQPMCCYCNFRKGNLLPGETKPEKQKKDEGPSRIRSSLKYFLNLPHAVSRGMPLEVFWELRAKMLTRLLKHENKLSAEDQAIFRNSAMIG